MTKKNKNILLVANYKSDVGYAWWLMENFWFEISKNFHASQHDCILIYPEVNSVPNVLKDSQIKIIEHDFSNRSISSLIKLLCIIRKNNIRNVYLTDKAYYDWIYFLLRIVGVAKIVNHDHTPGERPRLPFYKKIIKRAIHRVGIFSCHYYIGVSKFVKKRAIEVACVPETKCTYIHNGIRLFDNSRSCYAHDTFGIPKNAKIIVTTGRASFYKGLDILIKSAHVLINQKCFKDIYFLHVGNGPDLKIFQDMVMKYGLKNQFIFAGFRQDITKILPSCDIGVQVSLGEAFSLSILEYLCAGLATLAPNNCGNSEAIVDGVNGLLFVPGDINDIVLKFMILLNNTEFSQNIKKEARKSVVQNFCIENCNNKLIALLNEQFD